MKVGDIGVLQNLVRHAYSNGLIAKIVEIPNKLEFDFIIHVPGDPAPVQIYGGDWLCKKHQIRPITDPDAEQETEKVVEKVE